MGEPALTLGEAWLQAIQDGRLSVADAVSWSGLRTQDPGADRIILALARCQGSNAERQLLRWVEEQPWRGALPQPFGFRAPVATDTGGATVATLHCLLPHDVFASLWAHAPMTFEELFGTEPEREAWWAAMEAAGNSMPEGHRAREHRHWLHRHPSRWCPPMHRVPLGIHGDGGQMHGGEKITAVSWGGLVRKNSTADSRLLFLILKDSKMVAGTATLYKAFEVLVWSMAALVTGTHPAHDHEGRLFGPDHHPDRAERAGSPLAPVTPQGQRRVLCGAWTELRGDWLFLRDALGLKHHYGARNACHLCEATKDGPLAYGDHFGIEGALRQTLVGPFCTGPNAWATKAPVSPLTKLPGFSIWRCMFDIMHTLELGILQRVIPAALQGLMGLPAGKARTAAEASVWPGRSRLARCQAATKAYQDWARSTSVPHSSRVKRVTPRWVKGQFPDISQEHAKAAALRAMLPWVAQLAAARSASAGNCTVARLRARCLLEMAALDGVYSRQPRFLAAEQEKRAKEHCTAALQALAELAKLHPDGPWCLRPKCHAVLHIALDSAMQNPRSMHCYQDEDFIGRTKRTYIACHGATAPMRTLQRYCMGTSLMLAAREELLQGKRKAKALQQPSGGPLRGAQRAACSASGSDEEGPATQRGRGRPRTARAKGPRGRPRTVRAGAAAPR